MQSELAITDCSNNRIKMNVNLHSITYGPIIMEPGVPEELSSLVLPDSETGYAQGAYGKILFQEIHLGEINIQYNIFQVKKDLAIDFNGYPGMMQIHAALKNNGHYYIDGIGDIYLAEGQFNILDAVNIEGSKFLEHGHEYHSFHATYTPEILDSLLPVFPALEEWFASDSSQPRLLFKTHPLLTVQLKDIIESIIHCSYTDEVRRFYLELKIKEFLFLSMLPLETGITPAIWLTRRSIDLIHESRRMLDNNFDQHIAIADMARQLGINEFKLKAGFKKIFGISMFDYLIQTKMQKAKKLLLETDKPIKEIAHLTGYASKQSFLNAFKKHFHNTPGSLRKN
jgi:AraC family transcriptional activator of pyochelin receptor